MHVKKIGGQEFTESVLVVMLMLQNHGCFEPLCLDFPNALQCGGTNSDAYCSLAFFIEHPQRILLKKLVISVLFIDSLGEECERWSPPIPHQNFKAPLTCSSPESILCCRSREAILSSLPSPLQHLTSLQARLTAPVFGLQNPYLSLQVAFSWHYSGRFNSALPFASKFVSQTHPIKVLRKQGFCNCQEPPSLRLYE